MRRHHITIPTALLFVLLACGRNFADDTVVMSNSLKQPIYVWFWPSSEKKWSKPVFIPREGNTTVNLVSEGNYYLVVRDLDNSEDHLRWFDLHKLSKDRPGATLGLAGGYTDVTKQVTKQVTVYEQVQREGTRTVYKLVAMTGANGQTYYQRVPVTEKYTYTESVPVSKTVTETVTAKALKIKLSGHHNGIEFNIYDYTIEAEKP